MFKRTHILRIVLPLAAFALFLGSGSLAHAQTADVSATGDPTPTASPLATTGDNQTPLIGAGALLIVIGGASLYLSHKQRPTS